MAKPGFEPRKYGPGAVVSNYLVLGSFHLQTQIYQSLGWSPHWCYVWISRLVYRVNVHLKCLLMTPRWRRRSLWLQEARRLKRQFYGWNNGSITRTRESCPSFPVLLDHTQLLTQSPRLVVPVIGPSPGWVGCCLVLNDKCMGQGSDRKQIVGMGGVGEENFLKEHLQKYEGWGNQQGMVKHLRLATAGRHYTKAWRARRRQGVPHTRRAGALDEGMVTWQQLCYRRVQPLESWCCVFLLMTSFGTSTGIPRTTGLR